MMMSRRRRREGGEKGGWVLEVWLVVVLASMHSPLHWKGKGDSRCGREENDVAS